MKFELLTQWGDVLELELASYNRPSVNVCEVEFDGCKHLWFSVWQDVVVDSFAEDFDIVKDKIITFYKAECLSSKIGTPEPCRKPLLARFYCPQEKWELDNCKIADCVFDEELKRVTLVLKFDGCKYKNLTVK